MDIKILNDSKVYEKYKIVNKIGSGGFAQVYKIQERDNTEDVFYALKYSVFPEKSDVETTKKRFAQEIKIYSKVHSSKVAKFIDAFIDEREQYIIMEYVEGTSLKDKLREGRLLPNVAVNYALQIAEGLSELHSSKIIHRDIKSNNIMITRDRNIKIIDFGLALDDNSERYTQEQKIVGSVYYMAPEICVDRSIPTFKSDIYALGILLYEMLTAEYPFKGSNAAETINKQKNAPLPDITKIVDIPQALANVIIKATAKDPEKRYKTIYEFSKDLKTSLNPNRVYEKPLDIRKIKEKKTFQDIINSKIFIYSAIGTIAAILILIIVLVAVLV
ncbi:serine/threonine-protein kinase [Mycoplasmopsis columbina]|uniref:serine/threonine-protein kinase n=1 Tax=Mycoplasmopsis columbina TaxID=114881 RepID=UPI0004A74B08|nr:serine/threonine-protein kinase [Mycoplasmopsis columbina]VEU77143.1 serine/threonine protein kinase [Mycoplasmopsis columbina]